MLRREVKEVHEQAVIASFKQYCESKGNTFEVLTKPEPPDALVLINGRKTWIEITDAFLHKELAESVTSYVAEDKDHKSVPKEKRFIIEPEQTFTTILLKCILKKYTKDSIGKVFKENGSGILIVGINTPFSDAKDLAISEEEAILDAIEHCEKRFNAIYFYDPHTASFWTVIADEKID